MTTRRAQKRKQPANTGLEGLTLESVLTGQGFADIPASPLQVAITRAADGRPVDGVITHDQLEQHFGTAELPAVRPRRMVLVCGVRGGKSLISCCAAIAACLTADLSGLKPHERPRFAIIGPTTDAARATYVQLVGIIQSSPLLQSMLDGEPTKEEILIRRPDGRRVEIVVTAAHRGGLSVRNRWLVGAVFEEVASFGSEDSGAAVSAEAQLQAAETRLLPGCQVWLISSPFGPVGLLHALWQSYFGEPGSTLVVHAPTRALNPSFPQERIEEIRRESPDVASREYDAQWTAAEAGLLNPIGLRATTREEPLELPARLGAAMVAAVDPSGGGQGNGFTLALVERVREAEIAGWRRNAVTGDWEQAPEEEYFRVALVRELRGMGPGECWRQVAHVLRPWGVTEVWSDAYAGAAMIDLARHHGLQVRIDNVSSRLEDYTNLATLIHSRKLEVPPHETLRRDLLSVRKVATAGGFSIRLPKTADGRHCDFAPSLTLAVKKAHDARTYGEGADLVRVVGI